MQTLFHLTFILSSAGRSFILLVFAAAVVLSVVFHNSKIQVFGWLIISIRCSEHWSTIFIL